MTKLMIRAIAVSALFVLIGFVGDHIGAKFKSDEKALDIIKKARLAIGGDAAIGQVKGLVIKGRSTKTFSLDGVDKTEQGESEIALQLPDKMMRSMTLGDGKSAAGSMEKTFDVMVRSDKPGEVVLDGKEGEFTTEDGHKVFVRKRVDGGDAGQPGDKEVTVVVRGKDGEPAEWTTEDGAVKKIETTDGKTIVMVTKDGDAQWNAKDGEVKELNTADGKKIIVRKAGDGNATWTAEDGKSVAFDHKIAMDHGAMRQNDLLRTTLSLLISAPEGLDVSYTFAGEGDVNGTPVNSVVASFGGASYKLYFDRYSNLPVAMSFRGGPAPMMVKFHKGAEPEAGAKDMVFTRVAKPVEEVEQFVRFSDYRSTSGVQLPYKWTTTINGKVTDVFEVTSYDVNPADIAERFKGGTVMVRTKKPDGQ